MIQRSLRNGTALTRRYDASILQIMDLLKKGQQTKTWPPIHSYENCSMAQGNIKERFGSASWAPIHTLVRDVPDAEIFAFSSIVSIVASRTSTLALLTDEEHHCRRLSLDSAAICLAGRRQTLLRRRRNL